MQVSPASGSKDRVARCLLECLEKFKTSKPSTFPPLLLHAFHPSLLLAFRLLNASLSLSLPLISSSAHLQCRAREGGRKFVSFWSQKRNTLENVTIHRVNFRLEKPAVPSFVHPPRARIDSCDESSSSIVIVILITILTGGDHDDWAEGAFVS